MQACLAAACVDHNERGPVICDHADELARRDSEPHARLARVKAAGIEDIEGFGEHGRVIPVLGGEHDPPGLRPLPPEIRTDFAVGHGYAVVHRELEAQATERDAFVVLGQALISGEGVQLCRRMGQRNGVPIAVAVLPARAARRSMLDLARGQEHVSGQRGGMGRAFGRTVEPIKDVFDRAVGHAGPLDPGLGQVRKHRFQAARVLIGMVRGFASERHRGGGVALQRAGRRDPL